MCGCAEQLPCGNYSRQTGTLHTNSCLTKASICSFDPAAAAAAGPIQAMPQEEFDRHKSALASNKLQKDTALAQEADRAWEQVRPSQK
jgi:secreted Zn-dependent insulinase-like peptidase